jgi:hypothetical protein
LPCSQNAQAIGGKRSRYDDVVAFLDFKFRDGFVHPISTAEEYVVRRLNAGDARRVKLVKCEGIESENSKENRKGAKNVPTRRRELNRSLQMVGETHIYACDGKYQCLRMMPE